MRGLLMAFQKTNYPQDKKSFYKLLARQAIAMTADIPHLISNLANLSALLNDALNDINWVGFYLADNCEEKLVVGPFQGLPACVEIPFGKGVCGTCVVENQVMLVPDVHQFPGHIACDSASNSEIVLPIHDRTGKVFGVLDIDSPCFGRFDEIDRDGLLEIVKILENTL